MSNLIDIQNQIEKLQKQANDIKAREFNTTVKDILAKMQAFGITLKDLQPPRGGARKGKTTLSKKSSEKLGKSRPGVSVPAKYCGPDGQTWSGRGLSPRWLASLVAEGRSKEDFVIKS